MLRTTPAEWLHEPPKDRSERSSRGWARRGIVIVAVEVHDNPDERRYEAVVDGEMAGFAAYRTQPG